MGDFGAHHKFGNNRIAAAAWPTVVKAFNGAYTGTTAVALWTPESGKKFRLLGGMFNCWCSVVAAGDEAAGDWLAIYDGTLANTLLTDPIVIDNTVPGARFFTTGQGSTTLTTAATAFTTAQPLGPFRFEIPGGYLSAAADNVLRFGAVDETDDALLDISTGIYRIAGLVWGHEE